MYIYMGSLELFSGTKYVSNAILDLNYDVISLDRDMEADIRCDIMDWEYTTHPPKHFDIIWASPPLHGI